MTDKRQFQRVTLNVPGSLSHSDISIPVVIIDISLQGLRISALDDVLAALPFDSHEPYMIRFQANDDSPEIIASLEQLYRQSDSRRTDTVMGCKVSHIDVESLASLRRLIQLNSGDQELSDRDLDALINAIYGNASNASES